MAKLFLTGISGFIGTRLASRLSQDGRQVAGLSRSAQDGATAAHGVQWIRGDLLEPESYRDALSGTHTVLHLAAATGVATPAQHFAVNVEGTRRLLESCRHAGVRRIVSVSTIAVKYPDHRRYYYAQSKAQAEKLVESAGLPFTIVRPTIVVGHGSLVFEGLQKLAGLPVLPVFGNGRARVQPILVDDLVDLIARIVDDPTLEGSTLDLGGPDVLSIEEFLQEIRRRRRGRAGPAVHIPLALLLPTLATLETVAYRFMPVTVGQLSLFRFDGTAEPNALFEERRSDMRGVAQMLELCLTG